MEFAKKIVLPLLLIVTIARYCYGESTNWTGILGMPPSAQALGMGEAVCTVTSGNVGAYYNPAGLAGFEKGNLTLSYLTSSTEDIFSAIEYKFKRGKNSFGLSLLGYNVGDIDLIDVHAHSRTVSAQQDFMSMVSLASERFSWSLLGKIVYGMNLKIIRTKLVEEFSASSFAFDAGIICRGEIFETDKLLFGLSVQNVGKGMTYDEEKARLPMVMRLGLSYKIRELLGVHINIVQEVSSPLQANIGAEYTWRDTYFLYGGYKAAYQVHPITFGIGYKYKKLKLDYAMEFHPYLGQKYLITIARDF